MSEAATGILDGYVTEDQLIEEIRAKGGKPPAKRTIRSWRARGILPFTKMGKSLVLIPRDFDPADRKRRK